MLALPAVSGVTPSEPHYAAAGREAAPPRESATTTEFQLWEALGCSASLPQTSCLSSEPGTSLAWGQAAPQGKGNSDKGIFVSPACLLLHPSPGVTPTRWSHFSTANFQQRFLDAVSPQQDWVHTPTPPPQPFPQISPHEQSWEQLRLDLPT